jgi:hypothetical protein
MNREETRGVWGDGFRITAFPASNAGRTVLMAIRLKVRRVDEGSNTKDNSRLRVSTAMKKGYEYMIEMRGGIGLRGDTGNRQYNSERFFLDKPLYTVNRGIPRLCINDT